MSDKKRVCVIGAGTAGLCAVKNALEHNMEAVVYEQTAAIGGTWVYTDQTHQDEYGNEVVSSLYHGLRTNLPKEVMGYPDYLYPGHLEESFVGSDEVLKFLIAYAEKFKLLPHIKLLHSVVRVRPSSDHKWEVMVLDLQSNSIKTLSFDYVLVCNGHYTTPLYPHIDGMKDFGGVQTHSHYFRKANVFKDKTVLIIGAGPSGLDIALHVHKAAKTVLLSHHSKVAPRTDFMPNLVQKADVQHFTANGAVFKDGSSADFSCVIYCTGYQYTFPFLSVDCGIHVEDNHVQPLYKQCISINNPTLAIIGLPYKVCPTQVCDMQLRFILKYYTGQLTLPSREQMLADMEADMAARLARGLKRREAHLLAKEQFAYFKDLCETAGIENIKVVVQKILMECGECKYLLELDTYRNTRFRILDEENFEKLC